MTQRLTSMLPADYLEGDLDVESRQIVEDLVGSPGAPAKETQASESAEPIPEGEEEEGEEEEHLASPFSSYPPASSSNDIGPTSSGINERVGRFARHVSSGSDTW